VIWRIDKLVELVIGQYRIFGSSRRQTQLEAKLSHSLALTILKSDPTSEVALIGADKVEPLLGLI
jgi:hypothetical protein